MIKRPLLSLLILLCATSAAALDINGVALGAHTSRETLKAKLGVECPGLENDHFTCMGKTTIEAALVAVVVEGHNSVPTRILLHFPPLEYQVIGAAAILKWGKPTSSATVPFQNDFGARHDVVVYLWDEKKTGARATLSNVSDYADIGECQLTLETRGETQAHAPKKGSSL